MIRPATGKDFEWPRIERETGTQKRSLEGGAGVPDDDTKIENVKCVCVNVKRTALFFFVIVVYFRSVHGPPHSEQPTLPPPKGRHPSADTRNDKPRLNEIIDNQGTGGVASSLTAIQPEQEMMMAPIGKIRARQRDAQPGRRAVPSTTTVEIRQVLLTLLLLQ